MDSGDTNQKLSLKTKLIIAGIIVLVILIIGFLIYHAGRKKGSINESRPVVDNPNNPSLNTGSVTSTADINTLAERLHADMSGGNVTHNTDLWGTEVLTLSDTDFQRLYNAFNVLYQKDSEQTLPQWVANETAWYVPFAGTQWGAVKDSLMARFTKLNLV